MSDIPQGSALTTKEKYAVEVKAKAYDMFLQSDMDLVDIAVAVGVSKLVVMQWCRQGKWNDRKQEIELEAFRECESKYRRFVMEHRLPTVERHLAAASLLEQQILRVLQEFAKSEDTDSMELRRLAEALASSAGVSSRAAGVSDRQVAADFGETQEQQSASKKQPLVVVVQGGPRVSQQQPGDDARVVTVDCSEPLSPLA